VGVEKAAAHGKRRKLLSAAFCYFPEVKSKVIFNKLFIMPNEILLKLFICNKLKRSSRLFYLNT